LKNDSIRADITVGKKFSFGGIAWLVLAVVDFKLLLISEKTFEKRNYHDVNVYITWEGCTLRQYLNGEFYNNLGAEKKAIAETRNNNFDNLWYGTSGGNETTDKIFLLSIDEADKYFNDSGDYINKRRKNYRGSIEDKGGYIFNAYNESRIAKEGNGKENDWWLRSPGNGGNKAAFVFTEGRIIVDGHDVKYDFNGGKGVRPALWLNL